MVRVLLVAVLACFLFGCVQDDSTPNEDTAENSGAIAQAAGETEEPLPPPDLIDYLWARVDSGEVSEGEAIIHELRIAAGEARVGQRDVRVRELTSLIRTAQAYVNAEKDGKSTREIQRLLNLLVPDVDQIQRNALPDNHPAPQQSGWLQKILPVSAAHAQPGDCGSVTDSDNPAFGSACYRQRRVAIIGSHIHSVFYPASWDGSGDPGLAYVGYASQAIRDSLNVYNWLPGEPYSVRVVFSTAERASDDRRDQPTQGLATGVSGYCDIVLMGNSYGMRPAHFKQMIAHEIFHCYQYQNLSAQMDLGGSTRAARDTSWWAEGSAEYFSNVVYPDTNLEWEYAPIFSQLIYRRPIHHLNYENSVFFQYLGHVIGNPGIINLLQSMPRSGGREAQASALSGFAGMQDTFHEFGRKYLDDDIQDTGGGTVPLGDIHEGREYEIDAEQRFETRRFIIYRARLKFPGSKPQKVIIEEEGAKGGTSVQRSDRADRQPWLDKPEDVGTGLSVCNAEEQNYRLLMTAVDGSNETYIVKMKLQDADKHNKDMHDAAYRYRNFAGAIKYLEKGPQSMSPEYPVELPDKLNPEANSSADQREALRCQMLCSLKCICERPEMHSDRVVSLEECYRYNPSGRLKVRSFDGEMKTRCEFQLQDIRQDLPHDIARSSAFKMLESYCAIGCAKKCGRFPEGFEPDEMPIAP